MKKTKENILLFFFLWCSFVVYAQDITLLQQFNGRYDFTMIGNTLNYSENESAISCSINTTSSASLTLSNQDEIEKAYLYWAGSGTGDFEVKLNDQTIVAERIFSDYFFSTPFFSCFADVTEILQNTGNATYTLSELDLNDIISSYCSSGINFGGWAIIIIYKNDAYPINQLNIYDGLQDVYAQNQELTITINNLNVIDNIGAKIGFLAWEGDSALAVNETLQINGNILSNPPLNPMTNVFNGTNSFTGATDLYNMDLDYYTIEDYIQIGDTQAEIKLTSGQDFVIVNAIVTKLNSQLPDVTITLDSVSPLNCLNDILTLDFTVSNLTGISPLHQNTPISIYVNNQLITVVFTTAEIPVGESIELQKQITFNLNNGEEIEIKIVADDQGNGNGIVIELNEDNNEFVYNYTINLTDCSIQIPQLFTPTDSNNNTFFIENIENRFPDFEYFIYNRYGNFIFKGDKNYLNWNGKYNGKTLPTGTYFYVLYLHDKDDISYKGWVYLLN